MRCDPCRCIHVACVQNRIRCRVICIRLIARRRKSGTFSFRSKGRTMSPDGWIQWSAACQFWHVGHLDTLQDYVTLRKWYWMSPLLLLMCFFCPLTTVSQNNGPIVLQRHWRDGYLQSDMSEPRFGMQANMWRQTSGCIDDHCRFIRINRNDCLPFGIFWRISRWADTR